MKILSNTLEVSMGQWSDPGDYPNGCAAGPLRSYWYVDEVTGEVIVEVTNDDEREGLQNLELDWLYEQIETPGNIRITKWEKKIEGDRITLTVEDFDSSTYDPPEPNYFDFGD